METQLKWTRADDGALFGVCKGVARALDVNVGALRFAWIISVLFFGFGLGLYIVLAIALPKKSKSATALEPMLMGVCAKVSTRVDLEVGVVRALAIFLGLFSGGAAVVGYIVLYFVLDTNPKSTSNNV